jgi:hypothetical protein
MRSPPRHPAGLHPRSPRNNTNHTDLTGTGADQATSLNSMLSAGGWLSKMSGGKPVRAIISPLTRCVLGLM